MYHINASQINRHPNLASVREWYDNTKPWRGQGEDRPFGGRKQRWCVLRKEGEEYVVSAWGREVLRYRPDGYVTVTLPYRPGAQTLINRALPWVMPWGCDTTWLLIRPDVVVHYPHFGRMYRDDSPPMVVAVHEESRTVTLRTFTPGDPLFAMETLFENRERDLVSIPTIHANRAVRKAAYRALDLAGFTAWLRAYLQMNATAQPPKFGWYAYNARQARNHMPDARRWLSMLSDRNAWVELAGNITPPYDPARRAKTTVSVLRRKILYELGKASIQPTHYQMVHLNDARTAYDRRLRTMRELGLRIDSIPYAEAQPFVAVATKTPPTTTPERIDG